MKRLALMALIVSAALLATAAGPKPVRDADPHAVVRGMTISCPGAGRIWGSDEMVDAMVELKAMGVNWITIHPYAGIRADGTVGASRIDGLYADPTWLTRPIREAHRLGLKIMIKPHIAYWGSPFSWRGEIRFRTDEQWARFFETYRTWIVMVARLSADADAFVVGTELGGTVHREREWRDVIAAVRAELDVPLCYAANWDRFEKVPFWDAVDTIGIQSYFPLVREEGMPTAAQLDAAWERLLRRLEAYSKKNGRKILLAELGYNRSALAAVRPWEYQSGGADADEIQRRCMEAALRALPQSDRVVGAFLWKWFPGDRFGGNFSMQTASMRDVIRAAWGRRPES